MTTLRQSDMKLWASCALKFRYAKEGLMREQSGALTFGTIIHECVRWMEENQDLAGAIARFDSWWADPTTLSDELEIDYYNRGTSWAKYKAEGSRILTDWWSIIQWESDHVIAREHQFTVPIGDNLLTGTVDKLVLRYSGKVDSQIVLISDYKDLALDTPLPTPTGWTAMGDVRVGDMLVGGDGLPCRVVAKSSVYTANDCYRVTFDDGSSVVAGGEHLWAVECNQGSKVMTTLDMAENLFDPITGQRHLRIPNTTITLPEAELPIDPYVLGAWVGDGSTGSGIIHKPCPALFAEIARRGYTVGPRLRGEGCEAHTIIGLRRDLRLLGILHEKRIPREYLRASRQQRLDLLRGLMDTDGHWNRTRRRCVVNTTSKAMADDVYELAVSLGWKASTFETKAHGFGKDVTAWQTWFTPVDEEVFIARRPDDYRASAPGKSRRRMVTSVEAAPTVPTQCLQVDSADHTFLCGRQMVKTHNTNRKEPSYDWLEDDLQFTAYCYASTRPEFWATLPDGLFERVSELPRAGEWVQLTGPKRKDAGFRNETHYRRLELAVSEMSRSIEAGIYVPTISGETCRWCEYRAHCGLRAIGDDE